MMSRISSKNGWTLIEIMIVVFIIGIIGSFAIAEYEKALAKQAVREHMLALARVYTANSVYKAKNGNFLRDRSSGSEFRPLMPDEMMYALGLTADSNDQYPFATGVYSCNSSNLTTPIFATNIAWVGKRGLPSQYQCQVTMNWVVPFGEKSGTSPNPFTTTNSAFCKSLIPYVGP